MVAFTGTYFYLFDQLLNRFTFIMFIPVLPRSSFLLLWRQRGFTVSKPVRIIEFFVGRLTFLLELGRALMSGRNDQVDFCIMSVVDLSAAISIFSFLALSLLRSNPPPVSNYFLAFLSYQALALSYYCYLIYFLKASSALFCVYLRFSSYYVYFFTFYSSILCFYISALRFLSSSRSYFSRLFFSESSFSLQETEILSSWQKITFS